MCNDCTKLKFRFWAMKCTKAQRYVQEPTFSFPKQQICECLNYLVLTEARKGIVSEISVNDPNNMSLDFHVENRVTIELEIESIKEEVLDIKQEVVNIKEEHDSDSCIGQETEYEVELRSEHLKTDCSSLPSERPSNVPGIKQEPTVERCANEEQPWYSADHESTLKQEEQVHDSTPDHVEFNETSSTCEESNAADTPNQLPKDQKRIIIITEQNPYKNKITGKTYPCNICGKELKSKTYLRRHKRIHGDKPYSCDICHKEFTQKGNLNSHKRIHTGEKPYPCDTCEKVFTELGHLKRHIRTHTGAKPYVCEICDKKFKQTAHLKRHKLIHTGDRPYTCDLCDKTFSRSFHLQRHAQLHSENDSCPKKFTQITLLEHKKDGKISEPRYTCETCNKEFSWLSHLKSHSRIHKGEKPFNCDLCERKFTQLGQLKVHKQTHTGAKPHHCDICNIKFTLLGNLKRHIKRAHNQKEGSVQIE